MSEWVTVNKPYKKVLTQGRLDLLLEDDEEYTQLLDDLLRTKYEELSSESFDLQRYDMLGTAYLDRKGDYEDWEFAQEFKDLYEKYRSINLKVDAVLLPYYKKLEERRSFIIDRETSDSFVNMSLPEGTLELSIEFWGKKGAITLTPEVKEFINMFIDELDIRVLAYRVVKKPSILYRVGKRLRLCT